MKQLLFIGGPRYSGVTSIACRLRQNKQSYSLLNLKTCLASYYGAANTERTGFEKWLVETVEMLPQGTTIIDCGSYAFLNDRGSYESVLSAECLEKIRDLPYVRQIMMILVDVDTLHLQSRRMAAPFTTLRVLPTDFDAITKERLGQYTAFDQYYDVLIPRGYRSLHFLRQFENVIEEATTEKMRIWIEALRRVAEYVVADDQLRLAA